MRLIKPKAELLLQQPSLEGVYKQIELAGRTCYKSTDKITEDSAKPFVDRMINSNHLAMLEHGTVYLTIPGESEPDAWGRVFSHTGKGSYTYNKYSKVNWENWWQEPVGTQKEFCKAIPRSNMHITTNLRVLVENDWLDDLKYICEPTEYHEKRYTVRFTCDRGVSHELVRHRVFSFAQESTRYCNYSKNKFGNELTFIIPSWCTSIKPDVLEYSPFEITPKEAEFMQACFDSEKRYFSMLKSDATPQEARQVLINALKTEVVMTGFIKDWDYFFSLRTSFIAATGKPHPDMSNLTDNLYKQFKKEQFI